MFLVEPEPGNFGFEIRSLQEFWAAWALSCGRDTEVEARLHQIAKAPMFRNVLLFLASKFCGDASHLRDYFTEQVCAGLDDIEQDPVAGNLHAGALLALEALEEGSALGQPKRARALMERACGLLDLPFDDLHWRVLSATNNDTEAILQAAIEARIVAHQASNTAWLCLVALSNNGVEWARQLGDKHWRHLPDFGKLLEKCKGSRRLKLDSWLVDRILQDTEQILPMHFWEMGFVEELPVDNWAIWFCSAYQAFKENRAVEGVFLLPKPDNPLILSDISTFPPMPQKWDVFLRLVEFNVTPTAQSLADVLLRFVNASAANEKLFFPSLLFLWPLNAANIYFGLDSANKKIFAEKLKMGTATDILDWRAAEQVALNLEISTVSVPTELVPWDAESLKLGIPFYAKKWGTIAKAVIDSGDKTFLTAVPEILRNTPSRNIRERLVLIYCCIFAKLSEESNPFIKDLPENKKDAAICNAVLDLAKHLDLSVVAEGVETELQMAYMSERGCQYIQGYLTGKPMPPHVAMEALKEKTYSSILTSIGKSGG